MIGGRLFAFGRQSAAEFLGICWHGHDLDSFKGPT
jgi:hypothetical protein